MKKQKISLQLRKQKISSLSEKQINGGNLIVTTITSPIETLFIRNCLTLTITQQANCESLLNTCNKLTMASFCCHTTQPPTVLC